MPKKYLTKKQLIDSKMYYLRAVEEVKLAKQYEKEITMNLKKLCKKYNGKLLGLKYKIKNPDKVMTKIQMKGDNYELRDVLRYTIVYSTNEYTRGVYNVFIDLMNNSKYKTKHKWVKQQWCVGDMYQGINTSWEYNNHFVFELQFHTYESFGAKTHGDLHKVYDEYNKRKCESIYIGDQDYIMKQCREKRDRMITLEDEIPVPPELNSDKCGYDIEEWYKILNIPSKLKKGKLKKQRRKQTKKRNKTKRTMNSLKKDRRRNKTKRKTSRQSKSKRN